jgi:hypothetical protein
VGVTIAMVTWTTTLQEQVPSHALARVSAYDWLGSLVIMPLGFALAGPAAVVFGLDQTLLGAAALMVTAGLAALAVPSVRAVRRRDLQQPALSEPPLPILQGPRDPIERVEAIRSPT